MPNSLDHLVQWWFSEARGAKREKNWEMLIKRYKNLTERRGTNLEGLLNNIIIHSNVVNIFS